MRPAACGAALLGCLAASHALAAWPTNPGVNLPVCVAAGDQIVPQVTEDGAGGVIAVWVDYRAGGSDLYATHLDARGNRVAGWAANGQPVCTAPGDQDNPSIVGDGAGGAVIAWTDARGASADIYAIRIQSNGALAAGWPANGLALCTAAGNQGPTWILGDDAGGAFVVWRDARGAAFDLYAVRVRSNGNITGQWPANGLAVCAAPGDQELAALATDTQGGLYVAWQDGRAGQFDIYANRLRNNGTFMSGWGGNGRVVCASAGHQFAPAVASNGNRGVYVLWEDFRLGTTSDLFGLMVLEDGSPAAGWTAGGTPLCTAPGSQFWVRAIPDGAGNAIFVWEDYRNGRLNSDVFAQKVRSNGAIFPLWPANGLGVCTAAAHQLAPTLVSDGALGAIVLWDDYRAGTADADVYGKRVGAMGPLPDYWGTNGIPVSSADGSQQSVSAAVGTNPIVLWQDRRAADFNIYAQRMEQQGTLGFNGPLLLSVQPAQGFETDHVWLTWYASPLDRGGPSGRIGAYRLWRDRIAQPAEGAPVARVIPGRTPAPTGVTRPDRATSAPLFLEFPSEAPGAGEVHDWEQVGTIPADGSTAYSLDVALPGSPAGPGFGRFFVEATDAGDPGLTWPSNVFEVFGSASPPTGVDLEPALRVTGLESPRPNPVSAATRVRFTLSADGPIELAIFAVDGRRVRGLVRETRGAGPHEITWDRRADDGRSLPGGVYFVRLEAGGRRLVRRISVVP